MSKKHLHIRRINIRQVLIVCVLLLGLCAALAVFSTVKLQSNATDTVRRYADAFISRLSSELENNDSAMESTVLTTSYRSLFEQTGMEWVEQSGSLQNTYQLLNKLSINRYNYYVYENHQDRFLELTAVTLPFSEYRQIRGELKRLSKEPVVSGRYVLHEMPGGRRVILCMWVNDSFVCGSWITEEDFLSGLVHYSDNNIAEFSLLKYGDDIAVGAMTILSSVMQFAMLPLQGIAQGAQPITSYNYGARNTQRVRQTFRLLLKVCLCYSVALWAVIQLCPGAFARIFTPNAALVAFTVPALRIYCGALFLFGIQIACQMTFVSIGAAGCSIIVAVLRKFVLLIPCIYLLPHFFADQTMAVFLAEPVADAIAVTSTAILFAFQFKKAMRKLDEQGPKA